MPNDIHEEYAENITNLLLTCENEAECLEQQNLIIADWILCILNDSKLMQEANKYAFDNNIMKDYIDLLNKGHLEATSFLIFKASTLISHKLVVKKETMDLVESLIAETGEKND